MRTRKAYTTDLSDGEWRIIEPLLPVPKQRGRKIIYSRREILNAIFYLHRNGCTWRDLPGDFPPYGIVSHYYHMWAVASHQRYSENTITCSRGAS